MQEYIAPIRNFISTNFLFDADGNVLQNDASFLEQGIIDSTGVLELVEWLEEDFGLKIEDEELIPENLDSVLLLAAFIEKKRNGSSGRKN
jgi:acyl carrier protein